MKKQLLFKNTTQYSKKLYDEFTRFHNDKNNLYYEIFTIFILILLVYCLIETIKSKLVVLSIVFILALIIFTCYRLFNPILIYKKEVKNKAIAKSDTFKFYFYNNYFKVRDKLNFDKVSYFRLYKVYETDKYFYLYLTKRYSFIINKEGFTQGTAEEFSTFIKNKMLFKYSKCDSKKDVKKSK